ncbi:TetR/AcrR family transcriptional regulator [Butyrivibrio sp. VCB2006]|uniref:TetR/AcrR family transcriptional regulator n=1 Tax=Butyrivibrio sp. VCB2006 TaxID=1280679 RepID=UPI0003FDDD2A|nr:TetR-like C-terminal domain-containing protein [Butyrivibrio sp. VCB2006]
MQDKPISKISIKEICDLSEMSRSTFYLHYQDQYELLSDLENEVLINSATSLGNLDGAWNTTESIESFLEYVKDNKKTFGILLCQPETEDFQKTIISNIEKDVKESVPEILDYKNVDYVFTFVMHGTLNILRAWIEGGFVTPVKELAELIYNLCNNVAKKGN